MDEVTVRRVYTCDGTTAPLDTRELNVLQISGDELVLQTRVIDDVREYRFDAQDYSIKEPLRIIDTQIRPAPDGTTEIDGLATLWNGDDNHGRQVSSGVYWYQLSTVDKQFNRRMVLLR